MKTLREWVVGFGDEAITVKEGVIYVGQSAMLKVSTAVLEDELFMQGAFDFTRKLVAHYKRMVLENPDVLVRTLS